MECLGAILGRPPIRAGTNEKRGAVKTAPPCFSRVELRRSTDHLKLVQHCFGLLDQPLSLIAQLAVDALVIEPCRTRYRVGDPLKTMMDESETGVQAGLKLVI